ncbi:hypothetical protein RHMOL_Rhmol04G0015400 [Rhododendron molle]|uniref:Uncharacterized protein n=1 Tax=Rhododendron molle TaxID=49168 RepID=A0ACC0NXI0_RHOML|nr:hypothetical protein RHMOL_Rhmol04G0015400 [Rhododendron molle]
MGVSDYCFVEWKEQFVSKERGNRVVHYFLKDASGESILAIVGTERSVRHMFYVVSEEFLDVHGAENSVHAGFRWRSRREVVNWLTSMLSKQHRHSNQSRSPKNDSTTRVSGEQTDMPDYKGRVARNFKGRTSDIAWSGVAWTCGKQLKHYPSFCRNEITIPVHSFVFVMAEEDHHYLAYLEDMYEDRKRQKKVKVRWFHRNQEVKGVISLRNPHPKEVFITPYAQAISAECVDGPAIVLTREHYEKCLADIPSPLLSRVYLCHRQYKSNRLKPFKLSKLRGYLDQPIFSSLDPDLLEDDEFRQGNNVNVGVKRTRSGKGRQILAYEPSYRSLKYDRNHKRVKFQPLHAQPFKVNEKIELLCQDSGIRGCWFRCTVLQVSRGQMKVQYHDLKDEDGCDCLEEWVPAFRPAMPDKLGIRCPGRPTIRPAVLHDQIDPSFEVGAFVDAWWSDGWWEGIVTGIGNSGDESLLVFIPGENLLLNISRKSLRVSRDWIGDQWVDIEAKHDILAAISAVMSLDAKLIASSSSQKELQSDDFPMFTTRLDLVEEQKLHLDDLAPCEDNPRDIDLVNNEKLPLLESTDYNGMHANGSPEKDYGDDARHSADRVEDCVDNDDVGDGNDNGGNLEEFERESELLEVVA